MTVINFGQWSFKESEAIRRLLSFGLPLRSNDTTLFSRWKFSFFFFLWCKSDLDRWSLGEQIWPKFGPIRQRVAICIFFRSLEPKYWTWSIKTLNNLHIVKSSQVGHILALISIYTLWLVLGLGWLESGSADKRIKNTETRFWERSACDKYTVLRLLAAPTWRCQNVATELSEAIDSFTIILKH